MLEELPIPTPNGFDTVIALRVPEWSDFLPVGLEVVLMGDSAAVVDRTGLSSEQAVRAAAALQQLMRQSARVGGTPNPRNGWFTVTTDPELVVTYGTAHDCPRCRAETDQALARLREHPDIPLVVGVVAY